MEPEYPRAAAYVQARGYHHDPGRTIRRIVIHCTSGGPNAYQTAAYFAAGAEGRHASSHFVVGQDGTVIQCVRLADVAHHAHAANSDSIGIEHCANASMHPSAEQYQTSALLVAWCCDRYSIPRDRQHIVGHREADRDTTHDCPEGDGWTWDVFMALVRAAPFVAAAS